MRYIFGDYVLDTQRQICIALGAASTCGAKCFRYSPTSWRITSVSSL